MVTLSWYAWLALRRRVSMSAIGSVIVMGIRQPFSPRFPDLGPTAKRYCYGFASAGLPGSLRDPGPLAAVRHLADANPAEAELAVHRMRPAAPLAAGVRTHSE